jgi:hypothetical protein
MVLLNVQNDTLNSEKDFINSVLRVKSDELVNELLEKSSNQVRFTVLSAKQENISRGMEYNAFEILQKFLQILQKYKTIDSKMDAQPVGAQVKEVKKFESTLKSKSFQTNKKKK